MPQLHHVNLVAVEEVMEAEIAFVTTVLGFPRIDPGPEMTALGSRWYGTDASAQVHLSPTATPPAGQRGHIAVEVEDLTAVVARAHDAGLEVEPSPRDPAIAFCIDPAGVLWELRGVAR